MKAPSTLIFIMSRVGGDHLCLLGVTFTHKNLHLRKQCPPSSSKRLHTGQTVSIGPILFWIFLFSGRLLCTKRQTNCLGASKSYPIWRASSFLSLTPTTPHAGALLKSPYYPLQHDMPISIFTENTPFTSKCQAA
jgi:hypothetical protein